MAMLKPRMNTPDLELDTLEGGKWRLSDQSPENFTMI
ncbi:MAG: AhpC/TSA family protein, partial [Proteobacteria bacterium]